MPLPSNINDLSTSAGSNSPLGSESPTLIDDYLRTYAAYIAALRDVVLSGTANLSTANLAYTGTLTGGAGIVNLGSGQIYKDVSGNVGIGTAAPLTNLAVVSRAIGTASVIGIGTNTANKVRLGVEGVAGGLINGTAQGDFSLSNSGALSFSADNGTTIHATLASGAGYLGIANAAPARLLHVGDGSQANPRIRISGSSSAGIEFNDANTTLALGGANTLDIYTSGILRVRFKNTGGVVFLPVGAPGSPQEGEVYYDSTTKKHYGYNGTAWQAFY